MSPRIFQDFKSYPDPLIFPYHPCFTKHSPPQWHGVWLKSQLCHPPALWLFKLLTLSVVQCPSHKIVVGIKWIGIYKLLKHHLAHGTWNVIAGRCRITTSIPPLSPLTVILGQVRVSSSSDLGCVSFYVILDEEVHRHWCLQISLKYFKLCIILYLGLNTNILYFSNPRTHSHNTYGLHMLLRRNVIL